MGSNQVLLLESIRSVHLRAELENGVLLRLLPFARRNEPIAGHYDVIDGLTWMIYRQDGALTLRVDDASFVIDDAFGVALADTGNARRMGITRDGRAIRTFACPEPRESFFTATRHLTAFAEAEDSDLALLICNIASDRGRRERAYSTPERRA